LERPRDPDLAARLFGGAPEATLALLRAAWPAAVGEELARRTELVGLERGVLRVRVADLRWQRTLQRMRGELLGRLRRAAGRATPHALGFVTGEVAGVEPAKAMTRAAAPPAPPPEQVVDAAEAIRDPELRSRFLAAAGRYLARFPARRPSGATSDR
jgi:hypothetical protein